MGWSRETHNRYLRWYGFKQRLELGEARHAQGLDPRTGTDPVQYLTELREEVDRRRADFEAAKEAELHGGE